MPTRKGRGARTQDVVAAWYRAKGWPDARDVAAGVSGADIEGMLGLAPEVKARRAFEPLKWLRQAAKNAGEARHPFVVFRCDGQGETTVGEWGVLMSLEAHTQLLHEAGYGYPFEGARVRTATPLHAPHTRMDAQVRGVHLARTPCPDCLPMPVPNPLLAATVDDEPPEPLS